MAKIPDASWLGEREIATSRGPDFQSDAGQIKARALGSVTQVGETLQRIGQAQEANNLARAENLILQADIRARGELRDDQDFATHDARYNEKFKAAQEEASKLVHSSGAKAFLETRAQQALLRGSEAVRANASRVEGEWGRGELARILDFNRKAALEATDTATRDALIDNSALAVVSSKEKGYITPEQAVDSERQWKASFGEGSLAMIPAKDRAAALKAAKGPAGFIDPARRAALLVQAEADAKEERVSAKVREVLGVFETDVKAGSKAIAALKDSGLTPEEQLEARGQIQRGRGLIHAERRQEFNDQVTSLERAISSGVPGPKAEAQATFLYRRGAYSDEQYTNTLERIDNARQTGAKNAATMDVVTNALATGKPLDPRNDKVVEGIDTLFKSGTELAGIERGSDDWVSNATALAKKTNILPPDAMSWARANMLSGDPKLVGPAATALKTWATESPVAYSYFNDPNLKAYAATVSSIIDAGGSPERAVEVARQNLDIPPARQDALKATYTKDKHAAGNPDDLQTRMNGEDAFEVGFLGKSPPASQAMRDEYGAAVRTYFDKTGGDIAQARELAWADIRGVYGASTVNGYPEILKYAPERRFPGIDPEVIRNDAIETAKARGVTTPVRLVPTHATDTTQGVEWELHTVDEDGREEVVLRPDSRPVRYMIPTDTQAYVQKQEDAKRAAVEAARADSKSRRELADKVAELGTYPGM